MWGVSYWIFPVISGLCWLGTLLGLQIHWQVTGRPIYPSMAEGQKIAYISDVGAQSLKPLFIAGSVVTTIFLDASFLSERWLRHRGRLAANTSMFQKILCGLSMVFALIGTIGLICLSIFDTLRHHNLHDLFLALFIGGYVVSAVFICWEYQRLGIHFREHRILRISFWIKLAFILLEVGLAVGFGACNRLEEWDAAAILEWVIAVVFSFYVFSFFIDLIPAVKTKHAKFERETQMQMEENDQYAMGHDGAGVGRTTAESERTVGANDVRIVNGVKVQNGEPLPVASNF